MNRILYCKWFCQENVFFLLLFLYNEVGLNTLLRFRALNTFEAFSSVLNIAAGPSPQVASFCVNAHGK